jgi:hypothetical protein
MYRKRQFFWLKRLPPIKTSWVWWVILFNSFSYVKFFNLSEKKEKWVEILNSSKVGLLSYKKKGAIYQVVLRKCIFFNYIIYKRVWNFLFRPLYCFQPPNFCLHLLSIVWILFFKLNSSLENKLNRSYTN